MEETTSNVDTASAIVSAGDGDTAARERAQARRRRRWWWGGPAILVGLGLIGSLFIQLPYFEVAPGSARQVNDLVKVPKDLSYPPTGQVLLTTVSLERGVRPLEALRGWLDPNIDIVPERDILGKTPPKNFQQQSQQEMDDSIQNAIVVALRRIGSPVTESGAGALITAVGDGTPAQGHLQAGDVVVGIDGKPIHVGPELVAALAPKKFGDTVALSVTTGDKPARSETIKLGGLAGDKSHCSASERLSGTGCLGVTLGTHNHSFDGPLYKQIKIYSSNITGPSAGLAFTLALLDELKPGELTGGHKVAVTGTINLDGTVGEVGGVVQKTAAVRHAGAEEFLVPPGEFAQAKAHAGSHLKVVVVRTLEDALNELARLGGDISALGPPPVAH